MIMHEATQLGERVDAASKRDSVVATRPKIALKEVSRRFGDVAAVDGVTLDIGDGDFVVLVGPSGCGKSTLLRMIAGLQPVSDGVIEIEGRAAQDMGPDERDLAFVFQNYALYPHMSVRRNLSFPLLMRRFKWWHHVPVLSWLVRRRIERSPEVSQVIDRIAGILDLTELLGRVPATLSGGQRQRVALGRAMVREPLAFLMDEPLSNLDAKLRAQTRAQLSQFHRMLAATIVYVTHDQVEAMTMGDKIGVMRGGKLQQFGTPREVYENPANTFVAQFIGTPAMNLLPARSADAGTWEVGGQQLGAAAHLAATAQRATQRDGGFQLGIRSESVRLADPDETKVLTGAVVTVEDWGAEQLVRVDLDQIGDADARRDVVDPQPYTLDVRVASQRRVHVGEEVRLAVSTEQACLFDSASGDALGAGGTAD